MEIEAEPVIMDEEILTEEVVEEPVEELVEVDVHQAEGKSTKKPKASAAKKHRTASGKPRNAAIRSSARAGLIVPVGRIQRTMKGVSGSKRVSPQASVYLTAALEKIISGVLEGSWKVAADKKKRKRIRPREIHEFLIANQQYRNIFGNSVIAQGGVEEFIDPKLIPAKKGKKAGADATAAGKKKKKASPKKKAAAPKKKAGTKKPASKKAKTAEEW
jgi:histone H3/H4